MSITRRTLLAAAVCVLGVAGLFVAYLRMARAVTVNSDGASNALQAWDLFHGNPLLRGWTLSDVSFYPTELIQYALVQLVTGVTVDQIHVTAAVTWTLVVILAAWLAARRSRPDGPAPDHGSAVGGAVQLAVVIAILLVPAPGLGYQTLLSSPNHTGSAVPLLLAWLLVDRARDRAWMPVAAGAVLAWGALGDPLITFVGAVPLVIVGLVRAVRRRELRGVDLRLAAAGLVSVAVSHAALWAIERVGGFHAPRPPMRFSPAVEWFDRAGTVWRMAGVLFGTYRPGRQAPWVEVTLQAVHVPGLVLAVAALSLTAIRAVRGLADRVDMILAVAVACDLGAEIVSTLPIDLLATREIAPILPMSAVLAARVSGPWLAGAATAGVAALRAGGFRAGTGALPAGALPAGRASDERASDERASDERPRQRPGRRFASRIGSPLVRRGGCGLLATVVLVQLVALIGYAPAPAEPIEGQAAADWLRSNDLRYGLGSYWVSNNITLGTSRKVTVVPVLSGEGKLLAMCWQTHADMYVASQHDARFVLLEKERPFYGTPADVLAQFGPPVRRQDVGKYAILIYDRNLLDGLGTAC